MFGSAWAAKQFVFSPVLGSLSDRFGRRPVILLSNLGLGLDYALMALAPSVGWLFVGRLISGVLSSTYGAANAYIADVTPPEQRAGKFGLLGVAFGVAFVLGPSAGGLLSAFGLRAPSWAAATLSVANFLYGWFILPESLAPDHRSRFHWSRANPLGSLRLLRARIRCCLASRSPAFSRCWRTTRSPAPTCSIRPIATAGANGPSVWCSPRRGCLNRRPGRAGRPHRQRARRAAGADGFACGAPGMFIYGAAPTGRLFMCGLPMTAFFGLATPAMQSLMTRTVAVSEQGQLQGANGSLLGVANMLAPLVFTQVFASAVDGGGRPAAAGAPFLLAGGLLLTALLVAERALSRHPNTQPPSLPRRSGRTTPGGRRMISKLRFHRRNRSGKGRPL